MAGNDFVFVRLTKAGELHAGGTPLRHSNGRTSVLFAPGGKPVRIARFEWDMLFAHHNTPDGSAWFELAPLTDSQPDAEEIH